MTMAPMVKLYGVITTETRRLSLISPCLQRVLEIENGTPGSGRRGWAATVDDLYRERRRFSWMLLDGQ